ncbi:MAG: ParB N-terminal domain-containing protein [Pseudomonadota bacterium]|nr:ParB N-terminal domain-containing protein [Pseudomonadota bacterium]MDE3037368.1 ParB N-terminal domain-containing protein [Pseudomonadota bacterium]
MKIETVSIDKLVPYFRNPRDNKHAVAKLVGGLKEFGWQQPIVVDKDYVIIAGHTRLLAAQQLGMTEVPVKFADDLTPEQIQAYRIFDNRSHEDSTWIDDLLALELMEIRDKGYDLDLTGFDPDELEKLLAGDADGLTDEDAVPEVQENAISKSGDVWVCGNHRLVCADAANKAAIDAVMAGALADMVFTDPPYNVNYGASMKDKVRGNNRTIKNDNLGVDFYAFLLTSCRSMLEVCKGGVYICMSSSELHTLQKAFTEAGGHWSTFVIWAKNTFTMGRADYQRQYEPILYGWKEGDKHFWCGARDQGDVWFVDKPTVNDLHPTMKPVALVERAINNSSKSRDIVLDCFGGSGTTMIACEKTGRSARLIELEPKYCDVIIRRWQEFTGKQATLGDSKKTFSALEKKRD